MKTFIVLFILAIAVSYTYSATTMDFLINKTASLRNTKEGNIALIELLSNQLKLTNDSYDLHWQLAAVTYFYGDYYETEPEKKKQYFTRAKDYALEAVHLNPKGADGHYWLGVAYAKWSEANGILDSLFYADDVAEEMSRTIEIQPDFLWGLAWGIRAKVYDLAPGWPLSVGDTTKAYLDIQNAFRYGPVYRFNWLIYSDLLIHDGHYEEALKAVEKGLSIIPDKRIPKEEERTESDLHHNLKQLKKLMKK